VFNKTAFKHV